MITEHKRIIAQILERPETRRPVVRDNSVVMQLRSKDLLAVKVKEKDA